MVDGFGGSKFVWNLWVGSEYIMGGGGGTPAWLFVLCLGGACERGESRGRFLFGRFCCG